MIQELELSVGDTIQVGRHFLVVLDVVEDEIRFEVCAEDSGAPDVELTPRPTAPR